MNIGIIIVIDVGLKVVAVNVFASLRICGESLRCIYLRLGERNKVGELLMVWLYSWRSVGL